MRCCCCLSTADGLLQKFLEVFSTIFGTPATQWQESSIDSNQLLILIWWDLVSGTNTVSLLQRLGWGYLYQDSSLKYLKTNIEHN